MKIKSTDYTFVEKADADFYSIKILAEKWRDVIFTFGKVSITEDEEHDYATLSFDYRIEESAAYAKEDLLNSNEFKGYLGDILTQILEDSEAKIGNAPHGTEPTSDDT